MADEIPLLDPELAALARRFAVPPDTVIAIKTLIDRRTVTTGLPLGTPLPAAPRAALTFDERFERRERLGTGGTSEVYRVYDRQLARCVAMKIALPERAGEGTDGPFMMEARIAAGLQHPGIVPIYEAGVFPDGRRWLTMREVDGRRLTDLLADARLDEPVTALRRLITVFARICETMAFVHSVGFVHRDLKPSNVMVGRFGEVMVLDWGIACRAARPGDDATSAPPPIAGTRGFMSPEQIAGRPVDARSDVFSLGRILHEILLAIGGPATADADLTALQQRCVESAADDRPADASVLVRVVHEWLDGARRRAEAQQHVDAARAMVDEIERRLRRAEALEAEADRILEPLLTSASIDHKAPGWALEDQAAELRRQVEHTRIDYEQRLQTALMRAPDHAEARSRLGDYYRDRVIEAEAIRDPAASAFERRLRAVASDEHVMFLEGTGALTLLTDPPGAAVWCAPYVSEHRRLVPATESFIGHTPLHRIPLARGSHRVRIEAPGRAPVVYPLHLGRGEHWDGVPPGDDTPAPIALPAADEIPDGVCYIPAGWAWVGGDREAVDHLPRRRVWIDGFFIERDPLTCGELIEALNEMVATGRADLAARIAPPPAGRDGAGNDRALSFERTADGRYVLERREAIGPIDEWPVAQIDWQGARAWARWRAEKTGMPWRLPHDLEREKAARGADGRWLPWGDFFDPTWANVVGSRDAAPSRTPIGTPPDDVSPYGVRGLAGNVRDWCHNVHRRRGLPSGVHRLVIEPTADDDAAPRMIRGGGWLAKPESSRAAGRFASPPATRQFQVGVRLACSHPFVGLLK